MKANTIIVKPKDLERIIQRGINTLDPQMIPQWAYNIRDTLESADDVLITFVNHTPGTYMPAKPDAHNAPERSADETPAVPYKSNRPRYADGGVFPSAITESVFPLLPGETVILAVEPKPTIDRTPMYAALVEVRNRFGMSASRELVKLYGGSDKLANVPDGRVDELRKAALAKLGKTDNHE